jgi:hypothetical protein
MDNCYFMCTDTTFLADSRLSHARRLVVWLCHFSMSCYLPVFVRGVDRQSTEMKFTTEQRVFIVESFARKKLTENVSVSFVVNILIRQFPQLRVYPRLWKSGGPQVQCCIIYLCNAVRSSISSLLKKQRGYFQRDNATAHMANATMAAIREVFGDWIIYLCDVMRGMFASRRGSLWKPVIKHSKFVLSFYSILINVCKETDMRESANDCTLASGEGHGSCRETCHLIYDKTPISSLVVHTVFGSSSSGSVLKWPISDASVFNS